jgi:hypothetical protein
VQGRVERCLPGRLALDVLEPLLDRLERERVVAQERWRGRGEEIGGGVDRLAAVVDGRGLTPADYAVVLQLQLDHGLRGARAARDAELLGQGQR